MCCRVDVLVVAWAGMRSAVSFNDFPMQPIQPADTSILEIVKHFVVALMFPHMRFAGRSIDPSNSLSLDQQI